MQNRILVDMQARRALWKRVPLIGSGEGFSSERDGFELLTFDVYINYTDLEALAINAAKNKSGKSKDGALEVKITKRVKRQ